MPQSIKIGKVLRVIVLLLIAIVSQSFLSLSHAQTPISLYVSPNGSDTNPGTESQPFQTIDGARKHIQTINASMTSDITVYVRGGTYRITQPVQFIPADSGFNGHSIIYKNFGTEVPELNGAKQIKNWVKDGALWKAPIDTATMAVYPRQFYVNGVRAIRARNQENTSSAYKGAYTCLDAATCGFGAGAISILGWRNVTDIEFVGIAQWKMARCGINRVQSSTLIFDEPCYTNTRQAPVVNLNNWVENAYELLDVPGEWYLDRSAGYIFYIPRNAAEIANMNAQDAELPLIESLVTGAGTTASRIQNLTFQGINFAYTTWRVPNTGTGFVEIQANFPYGVPRIPGGVSFSNTKNLTFDHNVFRFMGGVGLDLYNTIQNTMIIGNHIYDISGTGMQLGNITDPLETDATKMVSSNTIKNNLIEKATVEYQSGVGLFLGFTRNSIVDHNEINRVNYTGISSGWGWFGYLNGTYAQNNKIQNNLIYQFALSVGDVGGLYSLGQQPGSEYSGNLIQSAGLAGANGLYIDDGSRGINVHDNASLTNNNQVKGGDNQLTNNWWIAPPQIDQYNQGLPSYYGITCNDPAYASLCTWGNIVQTGNHVISDGSQIPASFAAAGLEPAYQVIRNPREPSIPVVLPTATPKIGDANDDQKVDGKDYIFWLSNYATTTTAGRTKGDFNADTKVDGKDYILWLNNYST